MKLKFLALTAVLISAMSANAQTVLGKWKTIDDKTKEPRTIVEITRNKDGKIYGQIIEAFNLREEWTTCQECPGEDKGQPIVGLVILKGLSSDGKEYNGGKILDPSSGKLYKCSISLDGKDRLKVRGYIGVSALGRTQVWERVEE